MSHEPKHNSVRSHIITQLEKLVGLRLSAARRAANMRTLQFGDLRTIEDGSIGEFALHIQCPWRIEGPDGTVTGSEDLWEPIERGSDSDPDDWHYEQSPNLQDSQVGQLLRRHGDSLVIRGVDADDFGGAAIHFQNDIVLRLFPAGTRGEDWRLFRPKTDTPHFVIAEGAIEDDEDE